MSRNRIGFTWIELLVVIAIIAALTAILFPVFVAARDKARANTCLLNVARVTSAFRAYAADNGNLLPPEQKAGKEMVAPFGLLKGKYARSDILYRCPADEQGKPNFPPSSNSQMVCSYGFNKKALGADLGQSKGPGEIPLVMDFRPGDESERFTWLWSAEVNATPGESITGNHYANIHGGFWPNRLLSVNVGFADGHAKNVPVDDLKSGLRPDGRYVEPTTTPPPTP